MILTFISPRFENLLLAREDSSPVMLTSFSLQYAMRSQIHAKSLPMPIVEGNLKRLELMIKHPEYKEKLWDIALKLQKDLKKEV
jgi:glycine C-acetyltransferase